MNYASIMTADCANGVGVRVTLFVSGCENHCLGCFQPETWSYEYGKPFTAKTEAMLIEELSRPFYDGLTILGGDPMEIQNQAALLPFLRKLKERFPDKNVWAYTGYVYDTDLAPGGKRFIEGITDELLKNIDILVDGPFILARKNISLAFRGSDNQRIIDLCKTREKGAIVLHPLNEKR